PRSHRVQAVDGLRPAQLALAPPWLELVPGAVAVRRGVRGGDAGVHGAQAEAAAVPAGDRRAHHRHRCADDAVDGDAVPAGSCLPPAGHPVHAGSRRAGRAGLPGLREGRDVPAGGRVGASDRRRARHRRALPQPHLRRALAGRLRPGRVPGGAAGARRRGHGVSAADGARPAHADLPADGSAAQPPSAPFCPPQFLFGGDCAPEQWDPATRREDIALMRRAKVNTVSLGIFSSSSLEPAEGVYETGWLEEVIGLLTEAGIGFFLATPTASPPPWFTL